MTPGLGGDPGSKTLTTEQEEPVRDHQAALQASDQAAEISPAKQPDERVNKATPAQKMLGHGKQSAGISPRRCHLRVKPTHLLQSHQIPQNAAVAKKVVVEKQIGQPTHCRSAKQTKAASANSAGSQVKDLVDTFEALTID